jgi:hypothetical protein
MFVLFCSVQNYFSQVAKPSYSPLTCTFMKFDMMVEEGQVVTNVLSVKNQNGRTREFYIETGCPSDWKILSSSKRVFTLEPDDSVFIPIRLLPNIQTMKGGTKYNVSVFVVGTDGQTHAVCTFNVGKPKRVDWDMKVLPRNRIYFLNDQFETSLGINVSNRGEEAQDVNLSWKVFGQGLTLKTDSTKQRSFLDFAVNPDNDTTIFFNVNLLLPQRNFRRVDTENYRPLTMLDARKYTIYFRGAEPKSTRGGGSKSVNADVVKLNSAVDFIKLSNNYTVNSYGSSVIPLTWYSNLYNLLGIQPMWMNIFRVDMPLASNAYLRLNLQHMFTFYSPSQSTLRNLNGMASYNSNRLSLILGGGSRLMVPLLQGTLTNAGAGTGLSARYLINKNFTVGASTGVSPGIFNAPYTSRNFAVGAGFTSNNNNIQSALGYARTDLLQQPTNIDDYMSGFRLRFLKRHNLTALAGLSNIKQNVGAVNQSSTLNWNWYLGYSGGFFNNKINQSISVNNRQLININNLQLNKILFIQSLTAWQFSKNGNLNLSAAYNNSSTVIGATTIDETTIPVSLALGLRNKSKLMILPSLFYTYTNSLIGELRFRGVNIGNSFTDLDKNVRASMNFMGGYNKFTDSLEYKELFTANAFLMVAWRTLSANFRYNYGPMGTNAVKNFHYNGARYPQYIFTSLNYQFVFKANRFVSEWVLNHSWNNQTYANNVNFGPQVYYFTKNKWRFDVRFLYSLNARNNDRAVEFYEYQGYQNIPEPEERMTFSGNFNLSVGIKKEFGIPLPKKWRKTEYVDACFKAFLDFNGNKIMDNDEVPLENIVIKVNGHEVLTDKDGKAKFVNIPVGTYEHKIIPLVDLDGWFTSTADSIDIMTEQYYVPFTRGVKVAGSIVLDREKFTKDVLATLDLSGIKIFTTDTLGNSMATMTDMQGNFSFYVPYGSYILSMDEDVLGDRFYIAQNHIPMDLYDGMDGFYQSFFIIEKRRNVKKKKFNEKGELIMVDEVEGGLDRNQNNSTTINEGDSTVIHNNNTEYNIFNEERKGGGSGNINSDELYRELDERIDRLDAIIRMLLEGKAITKADNKILADALRSLKAEDDAKKQNGNDAKPFMETIAPDRHFHVVVGGFVYRENADRFVQQLKAKGMNEAVVIGIFNGYYLVRIKDYKTLEEGIAGQEQYKNVAEGVWVHKWP